MVSPSGPDAAGRLLSMRSVDPTAQEKGAILASTSELAGVSYRTILG